MNDGMEQTLSIDVNFTAVYTNFPKGSIGQPVAKLSLKLL